MRKLLTDPGEITRILGRSTVVFLAFHDNPAPYVVPMFFGFEEGRLYLHSAPAGTKIDLLRADPRVGFTAVCEVKIVEGKTACDFTASAESIAGSGTARIIENEKERLHGMDLIMRHYAAHSPAEGFSYRSGSLSRTAVMAIDIHEMTGRRIGSQASP